MHQEFIVRFWGVRGSYPVPGASTLKYGGNTPCIEVQVGGHTLILDAGTGIIALGKEMIRRSGERGTPITATILLSHIHHDHTQGLPYFEPAYLGQSTFYFFGPRFFRNQLTETLSKTMLPPNFPVELDDLPSLKVIRDIKETECFYLWPHSSQPEVRHRFSDAVPANSEQAVRVDIRKSYGHPQEGVFFYRIAFQGRSMVYATDTEGYIGGDRRLQAFAQGADLLIHDAHYTTDEYLQETNPKQGWGHSTPAMALEVARGAGVKQVAFFHLNPTHDDQLLENTERQLQQEFPHCFVAHEGLELDLFSSPDAAPQADS